MKIRVQVGRTFPGEQYSNYRPEFTIEQDVSEDAPPEAVKASMERWREICDKQLEKAETYWKDLRGKN